MIKRLREGLIPEVNIHVGGGSRDRNQRPIRHWQRIAEHYRSYPVPEICRSDVEYDHARRIQCGRAGQANDSSRGVAAAIRAEVRCVHAEIGPRIARILGYLEEVN